MLDPNPNTAHLTSKGAFKLYVIASVGYQNGAGGPKPISHNHLNLQQLKNPLDWKLKSGEWANLLCLESRAATIDGDTRPTSPRATSGV